mmetsp:Transcript_35234/g.35889  ORF Transcript_35234/g.35889 Transcript_35234/m.35889 type:complete len:198 (-) Transcript_35234:1162-1755(-)
MERVSLAGAKFARYSASDYGLILPSGLTFHRDTSKLVNVSLLLVHTSFTLYSYLEAPSFVKQSGLVFDSLQNSDGTSVPGLVLSSGAMAPFSKTLDTITVWTDAESLRKWYTTGFHGELMRGFFNKKLYPKTPRVHTERMKITSNELPKSNAEANEFWTKVISGEFEKIEKYIPEKTTQSASDSPTSVACSVQLMDN